MAKLEINGKTFNFPDQSKEPNWGKVVSDWAKEVSDVLNSLSGIGSIQEIQSDIENNVPDSSTKPIPGLVFSDKATTAVKVFYKIYRKTQLTAEVTEVGELDIVYRVGDVNKWHMSRTISVGTPTEVYLDIDNTGQVRYWSDNRLSGGGDSNYEGYIRFKTFTIIE